MLRILYTVLFYNGGIFGVFGTIASFHSHTFDKTDI
jgi:hypothetical protein